MNPDMTRLRPDGFRDECGMTLLEILLALMILGTIVSLVSVSLSGSLNVLNTTLKQGEVYHRAQVALQRITEDLASAVLVEGYEFIGTDGLIGGEDGDTLQFTSTAHVVFDAEEDSSGIAFISYQIREDPENDGELLLLRSDDLLAKAPDDPASTDWEGFLLTDKLRSVNFRYLNRDGDELDAWSTSDDNFSLKQDERKLPVAVLCTLEFWVDRENDLSIEFSTGTVLPVGLIYAKDS